MSAFFVLFYHFLHNLKTFAKFLYCHVLKIFKITSFKIYILHHPQSLMYTNCIYCSARFHMLVRWSDAMKTTLNRKPVYGTIKMFTENGGGVCIFVHVRRKIINDV